MHNLKNEVALFSIANFLIVCASAPLAMGADDVDLLKQQVAAQQKQIEELRAALEEQRKLLEQTLKAIESATGPQVASAGTPAPTAPIPAGAEAGGEISEIPPPPEGLELVKGELNALAESAAQANQRLAKLENERKAVPDLAGWDGSHPFIRSKDGNLTMSFGGRMQLDWRSYTGSVTPPSSFVLRRARLEAEGQLFRHYEYRVQADFADTGSRLLRDGYVNVIYLKPFQVQFGQFKAPFSQEELQSAKYIDFVERSSVNNLAPARSPGLMIHGKLADGVFEYAAGAFNARKELGLNTASTPEGYLRLRFTPFRQDGPDLLRNFSFGGAFADGRHKGDNSFAGRTASQSVIFFKPVPVNGEIVRANAEFWWRYKSFSLRGEYDQTNQYRAGLGPGGTNLPGVVAKGYVLQTTYLLTGESKGATGITPKRTFLESPRGPGAWELALRYENLQISDSENPNRAEAFTFGVNWWLSKFVRYQSNFVLERFKDPQRAPTPGDSDHFAYLSRIQVIF